MPMYNEELKNNLSNFLADKKSIVVVQGDNPDADSLASSLALEEILGNLGYSVTMYCSIDVANHLRYLDGWDRVTAELPNNFDCWVMVDCEYIRLLDNAKKAGALGKLLKKPLLIIDHHDSPSDIDFAEVLVCDPKSGATGQVIYNLCRLMNWDVSQAAAEFMTVSILSDTLGFNSDFLKGNSSPLRVVADLVDLGVSLSELNDLRLRQFQISPEIFRYKAELMNRVEFHYDNKIATIDIPHDEIKEYSMSYNPTVILDDARMVEGLAVGIGFKSYERDGAVYRITARIRCGFGYTIAATLASHFEGGGGHKYAAGFKVEGKDLDLADIKKQTIDKATELLINE
jgi:bifunctional oligoribonuclease and PAP phosphatase NrnA